MVGKRVDSKKCRHLYKKFGEGKINVIDLKLFFFLSIFEKFPTNLDEMFVDPLRERLLLDFVALI